MHEIQNWEEGVFRFLVILMYFCLFDVIHKILLRCFCVKKKKNQCVIL